ncbi:Chromosome partition protein Smc [Carpediemonas membranifera]|uniref:Chromosome partition protein Smc n=1 Tax=Carpediemonas membranifera TaxID=201153 RepID=A0A8J6E3G0_9EUKA|nr:Chromosome partition protein Smc [Carpediemonas membranifera]|eukprot:KAG9395873.1 Chromosome partition protein Smc [Carpediemonas membranifera]
MPYAMMDDEMEQSKELLQHLESANNRLQRMKQMVHSARRTRQTAEEERRRYKRMYTELSNEYQQKKTTLERARWEADDLKASIRRAKDRVNDIESSFSLNAESLRSTKLSIQQEHEDALDRASQRHANAHRRMDSLRDALKKENDSMKREEETINLERDAITARVREEEHRLAEVRNSTQQTVGELNAKLDSKKQAAEDKQKSVDALATRFGEYMDRMRLQVHAVKASATDSGARLAVLVQASQKLAMHAKTTASEVSVQRNTMAETVSGTNSEVQSISEEIDNLTNTAAELEQRRREEEANTRELRRTLTDLESQLNEADDKRRVAAVHNSGPLGQELKEAEERLEQARDEQRALESELAAVRETIEDTQRAIDREQARRGQIIHDQTVLANSTEYELAQRTEHQRVLEQRLASLGQPSECPAETLAAKERELAELNETIKSLVRERDTKVVRQRDEVGSVKAQIRELSVERKELSVQLERMKSLTQSIRMQISH